MRASAIEGAQGEEAQRLGAYHAPARSDAGIQGADGKTPEGESTLATQ